MPTSRGMLGNTPQQSAYVSQQQSQRLQTVANQTMGHGGCTRKKKKRTTRKKKKRTKAKTRGGRGRGREKGRERRGGGGIVVPQFHMLYTPQSGPGTHPNNLIAHNTHTLVQSQANRTNDHYASQL